MTDPSWSRWRIGIDVGGTFTDLIAVPFDGARCDIARAVRHKTPSSPGQPSDAVRNGLVDLFGQGVAAKDVAVITHGTTIGLNAILQGRGARVALVTSRGHRDLLQIARARLPWSFDLHAAPPEPAVPRERVVEIDQRFAPDGTSPGGAPSEGYHDLVVRLARIGPESVAVSLIGAYAVPSAEAEVADRLRADLGVPVIAAASVWPQAGEYERTALAVLDAQISPLMTEYLTGLRDVLADLGVTAPLFVTTSNGGSISLASALERPIDTVLSGPAAGVSVAARLWPGLDMVTVDMGGTSSDIGLLPAGAPALTTAAHVGDHPLVTPVVEVTAIGAGGGSIVWVDERASQSVLRVGPASAGAEPGPAAYGRGGLAPTLTDAYLRVGVIAPESFLGGSLPLSAGLAQAALKRAARSLPDAGASGADRATQIADTALRVASAGMASSMRTVLARHGEVPERFTLVAYGGAGGTHAALLADEVGAREVIVPAAAATFCALGAAITPVRRELVRTVRAVVDDESVPVLDAAAAQLLAEGVRWLGSQGSTRDGSVTLAGDLRYRGQPATLSVALATAITGTGADPELHVDPVSTSRAFGVAHRRRYGFADPSGVVEIEALRLSVAGAEPRIERSDRTSGLSRTGRRSLRYRGSWSTADVLAIVHGDDACGPTIRSRLSGPAVVERADTSVLVPPGWDVAVDAAGDLRLTKTEPGELECR